MKFAPSLSYLVTPNFSIGGALHINYGSLDLGDGTASNFSFGAELGAIYKTGPLSLGAVYITPQKTNHKNVANFDKYTIGSTSMDNLELESPQTFGFGIAYEPIQNVFLIETDVKWLNWADADGYEDFGWKDQWVFNVGAQYKPIPSWHFGQGIITERALSRTIPGTIQTVLSIVQGKMFQGTNYEILRIAGFPAIVEHHITAGIGYQLTKTVSIDLAYMHAFENDIKETWHSLLRPRWLVGPASVEASLYEDSLEFGITWRF